MNTYKVTDHDNNDYVLNQKELDDIDNIADWLEIRTIKTLTLTNPEEEIKLNNNLIKTAKKMTKEQETNLVECECCGGKYEYYTESKVVQEGGTHICPECWDEKE